MHYFKKYPEKVMEFQKILISIFEKQKLKNSTDTFNKIHESKKIRVAFWG